jgi:hypothetical protein
MGVGVEIEAEARILREARVSAGKNEGAQNGYLQGKTEALHHQKNLLHTD